MQATPNTQYATDANLRARQRLWEVSPREPASFALYPHMLYHVADRRAAARELRRVTRPGGTCLAVTNSGNTHPELRRLIEEAVGHGWTWRRPADVAFSLENGADQLRAGFARVERVDCPTVTVSVTDMDALAAYVASIGDHYATDVAAWTSWDDVVAECRHRAAAVVAAEGAFTISGTMGAFVCR